MEGGGASVPSMLQASGCPTDLLAGRDGNSKGSGGVLAGEVRAVLPPSFWFQTFPPPQKKKEKKSLLLPNMLPDTL